MVIYFYESLAFKLYLRFVSTLVPLCKGCQRMVRFYKEYQDIQIGQPSVAQLENEKMPLLVAQIPWTHNIILIEKIKERLNLHQILKIL